MFVGASVKGRYLWPQEPAAAAAAAAAAALRFASPFQLNAGRAGACTSALQQTSFICLNSKHHLPVFIRFKQKRSRILRNIISPLAREKKLLCRFTKKLTTTSFWFPGRSSWSFHATAFPPHLSANSNWFLGTLKMAPIPALIMHLRVLAGPQSAADIQSTAWHYAESVLIFLSPPPPFHSCPAVTPPQWRQVLGSGRLV